MNFKILFAFFLFLLGFGYSFAQTNDYLNYETVDQQFSPEMYFDSSYFYLYRMDEWREKSKVIVTKRDTLSGRNVEFIKSVIGQDSIWSFARKENYTYNINNDLKSLLVNAWMNDNWNDTLSFVKYNDDGNRLKSLFPLNNRQTIYEYNDSKLLILKTEYRRDHVDTVWNLYSKTQYEYLDDKKNVVIFQQYVDMEPINVRKDTFIYNSDEDISIKSKWNELTESWDIEEKTTKANSNGYDFSIIQKWKETISIWENFRRVQAKYIEDGRTKEYVLSFWDATANEWIPSSRNIWEYDDEKWLISSISESWDVTNEVWLNSIATTYDRIGKEKITEQLTQFWNRDSETYENRTRTISYWSEKDYHVNIDLAVIEDVLIFPNPTSYEIILEGVSSDDFVQIFAMDGRLVIETFGNKVNVARLENGVYVVKTNGFLGKFIKR